MQTQKTNASGARSSSQFAGWIWPTSHQCKWIDGDPRQPGNWHWCLDPVDEAGGQYCAAHTRLVYMPERPR